MIKLSRLTDYAVTLLTQMVGGNERIWAASDLADKTGLPLPTVSKVLKQLARAGILKAQRGATGGYRLAGLPDAISVASVVEAMDGPIALTERAVCPMSGSWNKINRAVKGALADVSLADMARP